MSKGVRREVVSKMGRQRAFDTDTVVQAARDVFWQCGYELTSISDLEERTGLPSPTSAA